MELKLLVVTFSLDLNDIVEITFCVCFEGNIHFDSQAGGKGTLHVVLNLEFARLRGHKFQPSDSFADVPDGHCYFVILIWLDI